MNIGTFSKEKVTAKSYFILSLPIIELSYSVARPGQAAKNDVVPCNLNWAESSKCSWLSYMLSSFSCLVSSVKMPLLLSRPGCSNGSDKDPVKS